MNKQRLLRFNFILLVLLALNCVATAEHLPVRIYTSADGLGSGFVEYVMRDSRGFMWFCTRDGLSRFDGSHFVTFRVGDKNSPPGIEHIYETREGVYWVTTSGGTYRFKSDAPSLVDRAHDGRPFLNAEFVSGRRGVIFQDRAGTLWYAADGLFQVKEQDGKVVYQPTSLNLPVDLDRQLLVLQLLDGPDDSLWLLTNLGVMQKLADGRTVLYGHSSLLRGGSVSIVDAASGIIWAAWGEEIFALNPRPIATLPQFSGLLSFPLSPSSTVEIQSGMPILMPPPGEAIQFTKRALLALTMKLGRTSDNHIWIAWNDALFEFDGKQFQLYSTEQGLPTGMASMAEDNAGSLWLGGRNGLTRLDRRGMTSYGPLDGLHSQGVFSINESADGTIYIANSDYYLSSFDGRRFATTPLAVDARAKPVWISRYAFLSSKNEWWILSNSQLYIFSPQNFRKPIRTYSVRDGFRSNSFFQIFEDSKGAIWVSQQGDQPADRSLYRLNPGGTNFQRFSEKDNFPAERSASCFVEDRQGNIWLGFYEGGIARYKDGRFDSFAEIKNLPPNVVSDLLIDIRGRLWIATVIGGLVRIDDTSADHPVLVPFNTDQGLSSNNVRTLIDDQFGNIYAGTVRGIDKISIETERTKHYSVNDGLAGDFVVDSHRDRSGALWFATTGGLSRLVPGADFTDSKPPIWLGGLKIAGEEQPLPELGTSEIREPDLTHTRNNLQIEFFSLSFRPGEVLRYQFMLEGADSNWSAPTELRSVTYANLRPGSYRFVVRAINADGLVSDKPAFVSFRILPPLWLRWWFISAAILLAAIMIYSIYRYRLARLREVNSALAEAKHAEEELGKSREDRIRELERVRSRIATDLHDDIGSSLTQIAIMSEVARQQSLQGNGGALQPLKSIASVSNELVETMSDIVWAINPQRDHLQDLIQRMRRFASDLLSAKNIPFSFEVPSPAPEVPLGANPRREVFLIFKESLTNIVKHAHASHVSIEFAFSGELLKLKISDNGKGFDSENISAALFKAEKGGHGISSMKRRALEMGGRLDFVSTPGTGTTVEFHLPLDGDLLGRPSVSALS